MRFRRAFIVLVACLAPPAVAAAQNARQVDIAYEITFAGISGFRIDVTARFNGSNYDVETSTFKEGMLKAVTMNYFGRNRAWGGFSTRGAQPTAGSLSISSRSLSVIVWPLSSSDLLTWQCRHECSHCSVGTMICSDGPDRIVSRLDAIRDLARRRRPGAGTSLSTKKRARSSARRSMGSRIGTA